MTSLPPEAAGAAGGRASDVPAPSRQSPGAAPLPAAVTRPEIGGRLPHAPRPLPPVRPSEAPVELTLDLRATPPDKIIARLLGALERVSPEVTLYVLLRDTPEYVGVTASAYQALRSRGYFSDSSRTPQGGQRLRITRHRDMLRPVVAAEQAEVAYAPAPERAEPEVSAPTVPPALPLNGGKVLPGERLSGWAARRPT